MINAVIGIDLGGTNIKSGIVDLKGQMLRRRTVPTESSRGADALIRKLADIVAEAADYASRSGIALIGVGVGTAGQVHAATGAVAGATEILPGWAGMLLAERLKSATGLGVVVDNDVNMIAMGEAWRGAGGAWNDFLCVALGTGVGGCWVVNRRVYHGRDGFAGEFGHMTIEMEGVPCSCGNRGCWEQYASVTALKRLAAESCADSRLHDPIVLFEAAKVGDAEATWVVDRYARYIAAGLVNLIHIANPSAIVIGGAIAAQGDFLFDRIRKEAETKLLPVFHQFGSVAIVPAALGEEAGVIGAAGSYISMSALNEKEGG